MLIRELAWHSGVPLGSYPIVERIGQQIRAPGIPKNAHFVTVSALLNDILCVGGRNAANGKLARTLSVGRSDLLKTRRPCDRKSIQRNPFPPHHGSTDLCPRRPKKIPSVGSISSSDASTDRTKDRSGPDIELDPARVLPVVRCSLVLVDA